MKVLISALPFSMDKGESIPRLTEEGLEHFEIYGKNLMQEPEFLQHLETAEIIILGNAPRADDAFLDQAPRLQFIGKTGVGLDNVDLAAATRHGVVVFNTPGVNTRAVADHTFGLMLNLARKISVADRWVKAGRWEKLIGLEISQKRLGIVGLGAIGRAVVQRAKGFDMACAACEPFWPEAFARKYQVKRMDLNELLAWSDVVTVHCPLVPETRGLISARELRLMRPSSLLINTARGGIVDENALVRALEEGIIAGAGLDAFEQEPLQDSALLGLDNVLLTPHVAWLTREALQNMNLRIIEQVIAASRGQRPKHVANPQAFDATEDNE
jgi:D-3-phosphoglycerate dehydrogenase